MNSKGFYSKWSAGRPKSPRQVYRRKSNRRRYRPKLGKGFLGWLFGG